MFPGFPALGVGLSSSTVIPEMEDSHIEDAMSLSLSFLLWSLPRVLFPWLCGKLVVCSWFNVVLVRGGGVDAVLYILPGAGVVNCASLVAAGVFVLMLGPSP